MIQMGTRLVCDSCGRVLELALHTEIHEHSGLYYAPDSDNPRDTGWFCDGDHVEQVGYDVKHGDRCYCADCSYDCPSCGFHHGGPICPCIYCNGTGKVTRKADDYPCPKCRLGTIGKSPCPRCNDATEVALKKGDPCPCAYDKQTHPGGGQMPRRKKARKKPTRS